MLARKSLYAVILLVLAAGCSLKKYAINKIGDTLASGNSVYESDEDIELVGEALPFGLKLMESLLAESPNHRGLLVSACQGFVLYSYAYVDYEAQLAEDEDLDRARALRTRARKLYLRAYRYGMRGLEVSYPGLESNLVADPAAAAGVIHNRKKKQQDIPLLYWTAASLGLAISMSTSDAALLARLPEVEAMLDRALDLDESWDAGALHAIQIQLAAAKLGKPDYDAIRNHYRRALALSEGKSAGLYVVYAEAVSVPKQNKAEFRSLLQKALSVDPDETPQTRLVNLLAHRRAALAAGAHRRPDPRRRTLGNLGRKPMRTPRFTRLLLLGTLIAGWGLVSTVEAKIRIRLGTIAPKDSAWHDALKYIRQEWRKISGGEVDVVIIPGSQLGDGPEMVRKVRLGDHPGGCPFAGGIVPYRQGGGMPAHSHDARILRGVGLR